MRMEPMAVSSARPTCLPLGLLLPAASSGVPAAYLPFTIRQAVESRIATPPADARTQRDGVAPQAAAGELLTTEATPLPHPANASTSTPSTRSRIRSGTPHSLSGHMPPQGACTTRARLLAALGASGRSATRGHIAHLPDRRTRPSHARRCAQWLIGGR